MARTSKTLSEIGRDGFQEPLKFVDFKMLSSWELASKVVIPRGTDLTSPASIQRVVATTRRALSSWEASVAAKPDPHPGATMRFRAMWTSTLNQMSKVADGR